jgi:uncharacterized protein (TIGR02996 family)
MRDLKGWVAVIRAEAEDDAPRMACADWFEERGEAERGEFIRVQCALARLAGDDPRRPELTRREDELLAAHEADWLFHEVPAWAREGAEFGRGFVEHVSASAAKLRDGARGLVARTPVSSLRVARAHPNDVECLAAIPLARLRRLHLHDFHPESVGPLLVAPFFAELRGLHLSGWSRSIDVEAVAALLESDLPAHLTHLDLHSFRLDVPGVERLVRSAVAERLESLHLSVLDDRDVRVLATSDRLANLRTLDLGGNVLLHDEAARLVAGAAHFGRLTRLSLRGVHNLSDDGVRALAAARLPDLTDLDLSGTRVTVAGVRALIESPGLPRLSRIDLGGARGEERVAKAWPVWRSERTLGEVKCTLWVRAVRG